MSKKLIFLNEIDIKESPKVRAELNREVAAEYGLLIKADKDALPPPVLFQSKGEKFFRIGDGLHRITGAQANGLKALVCEVREGGYEAALEVALGSNTTHGLRRSTADKRRCVEEALAQWPKLSDNEVGKRCQVDHKTVSVIRKVLEGNGRMAASETRVSKSGVVRSATRRIGNSLKEEANAPALVIKDLRDSTGFLIPKDLYPLWLRTPECQNLLDQIAMVKREVARAKKDNDLMYAEVNIESTMAFIGELNAKLKVLIPYAVCTSCQGKLQSKCSLCHGRGLISKHRWDLVAQEVKDLRAKEVKEAK